MLMEPECNSNNENHPITWGKAYLYALGWLICWSTIVISIVWWYLSSNDDLWDFIIFLVGITLPIPLVMAITKYVHHSWRVAIAFIIEAVVVSGFVSLVIFMLVLSAAAHPV